MENRKIFHRFQVEMKGRYFLEEKEDEWKECTVINISREGMGITFLTHEKIDVGSSIHLEMFIPTELESIRVKGTVKWREEKGNAFVGGIGLTRILDKSEWAKLTFFLS